MKNGVNFVMLIIMLAAMAVGLSSCSEQKPKFDIHNGVSFGMTASEVVKKEKEAGLQFILSYLETTAFDQNFTYIIYAFADDDKISQGQNAIINGGTTDAFTQALLEGIYDDGTALFRNDSKGSLEYNMSTDAKLVQVQFVFTEANKYKDAINFYNQVEDLLTTKYGATKYTSLRGQSMKKIYSPYYFQIITQYPSDSIVGKGHEVPYYSQRCVKISDSEFVVIDHHIDMSDNGFIHRIVMTIVPVDFSKL